MRTKTWSLLASWVQPLSVLSSCCSWGSRLASSVGSGSRSWAGKGMNWGQRGSGSSAEPPIGQFCLWLCLSPTPGCLLTHPLPLMASVRPKDTCPKPTGHAPLTPHFFTTHEGSEEQRAALQAFRPWQHPGFCQGQRHCNSPQCTKKLRWLYKGLMPNPCSPVWCAGHLSEAGRARVRHTLGRHGTPLPTHAPLGCP